MIRQEKRKIYDIVIIGAGQAGLSMGYYLKKSKLSFLILEKDSAVGEVWNKRYDSLTLFTPHKYSSLPGLPLGESKRTYPTKKEIANYLSEYASAFSLPVQVNTCVEEVTQTEDGFNIMTNQGTFLSQNVVIATGPFTTPFIPPIANHLSDRVLQLHSSEYRNPAQLQQGAVLVVGGGNSGAQIAVELSNKKETFLSVSHKMKFLPQDIGQKSIFWYFDKLGVYRASADSFVGKLLKKQHDPIFGFELKAKLRDKEILMKPRTIDAKDDLILFEDGSKLQVENIIWSTGFKPAYDWIKIPGVTDSKGAPIHQRGVTQVKGLFFLGLPWQHSRGSALLQGVGADAEYLYKKFFDL